MAPPTRVPSLAERFHYGAVRAANPYLGQQYCQIPFPNTPDGTLNEKTIFLGQQPTQDLMSSLCKTYNISLKSLFALSILEPFEHETTEGVLPQQIITINARDNKGMKPQEISAAVNALKTLVDAEGENTIYVHCKSGVGRSATVIAAYFHQVFGTDLTETCLRISQFRPKATLARPGHYHIAALKAWALSNNPRGGEVLICKSPTKTEGQAEIYDPQDLPFCQNPKHFSALSSIENWELLQAGRKWLQNPTILVAQKEPDIFTQERLNSLVSAGISSQALSIWTKLWNATRQCSTSMNATEEERTERRLILETLVGICWAFGRKSEGQAGTIQLKNPKPFLDLIARYEVLTKKSHADSLFLHRPQGHKTVFGIPILFESNKTPLPILPFGHDYIEITQIPKGPQSPEEVFITFSRMQEPEPADLNATWPSCFAETTIQGFWEMAGKTGSAPALISTTLFELQSSEKRIFDAVASLKAHLERPSTELPRSTIVIDIGSLAPPGIQRFSENLE